MYIEVSLHGLNFFSILSFIFWEDFPAMSLSLNAYNTL